MALTAYRTWVYAETVTSAMMNEQIRDNGNAIWVGTTAGDMDYYTSSTTKARLAAGTANEYKTLRVSSGGTAVQWAYEDKTVVWRIIDQSVALTTGDDKDVFIVPIGLNLFGINDFDVAIDSGGTAGVTSIQLYNETTGHDILTTKAYIDANELTSYTAGTQPVISNTYKFVSTGDRLRCDVDTAGSAAYGLTIHMKLHYEDPV